MEVWNLGALILIDGWLKDSDQNRSIFWPHKEILLLFIKNGMILHYRKILDKRQIFSIIPDRHFQYSKGLLPQIQVFHPLCHHYLMCYAMGWPEIFSDSMTIQFWDIQSFDSTLYCYLLFMTCSCVWTIMVFKNKITFLKLVSSSSICLILSWRKDTYAL